MTLTEQLSFPTASEITHALATDPARQIERDAVIDLFRQVAAAHDGIVDPNVVRPLVPTWISPRVVSAQYRVLKARGVLTFHAWTTNRDLKGRNVGKQTAVYEWRGDPT